MTDVPFTLQDLIQKATEAKNARAFLTVGGGVLLLGLLLNMCRSLWAHLVDDKALDWKGPVMKTFVFAALLGLYGPIVTNTVMVVSTLGTMEGASADAESMFWKRFEKFQDAYTRNDQDDPSWYSAFTLEQLKLGILEAVALLSFVCVMAAVHTLKMIQSFCMAVVVAFGPIMLAASSLGGFLAPMALAWFWALLEVTFWGVTMNILNWAMAAHPPYLGFQAPSFWNEVVLNILWFVAVVSVPVITSRLLRSGSIGDFASKAVIAVAAARAVTMAPITNVGAGQLRRGGGALKSGVVAAGSKAKSFVQGLLTTPQTKDATTKRTVQKKHFAIKAEREHQRSKRKGDE